MYNDYRITYAVSNNFFKEQVRVTAQNEIDAFGMFFKFIRKNTKLNKDEIWDIQVERI